MNLSDYFSSIFLQAVELVLLVSLFVLPIEQYVKCLDTIRDKRWGTYIPIFVLRCIVFLMGVMLYSYAINIYVDSSMYKLIILSIVIPGAMYYGHSKNWSTPVKFYYYLGAFVITLTPF